MNLTISLSVNGNPMSIEADSRTLLVDLLRNKLGLTGTHVGCDTSQCGACTIHVDGRAVKSCTVLAAQMQDSAVTTIEGITGINGSLHPMQQAFKDCHGLQCGFCTPGMVMSALDLVSYHPLASAREVREMLEGNLCRCTGYHNIVEAITRGAVAMSSTANAQ